MFELSGDMATQAKSVIDATFVKHCLFVDEDGTEKIAGTNFSPTKREADSMAASILGEHVISYATHRVKLSCGPQNPDTKYLNEASLLVQSDGAAEGADATYNEIPLRSAHILFAATNLRKVNRTYEGKKFDTYSVEMCSLSNSSSLSRVINLSLNSSSFKMYKNGTVVSKTFDELLREYSDERLYFVGRKSYVKAYPSKNYLSVQIALCVMQ